MKASELLAEAITELIKECVAAAVETVPPGGDLFEKKKGGRKKKAAAKKPKPAMTLDQFIDAAQLLLAEHGEDALRSVLPEFELEKVTDCPAASYEDFLARVAAVAAEAE